MKFTIAVFALIQFLDGQPAADTRPVQHNAGVVRSVTHKTHGDYPHTVIQFLITSSAQPIPVTIWLFNDDRRLAAGDRVEIEWASYGTDTGGRAEPDARQDAGFERPGSLQELVSVRRLP